MHYKRETSSAPALGGLIKTTQIDIFMLPNIGQNLKSFFFFFKGMTIKW